MNWYFPSAHTIDDPLTHVSHSLPTSLFVPTRTTENRMWTFPVKTRQISWNFATLFGRKVYRNTRGFGCKGHMKTSIIIMQNTLKQVVDSRRLQWSWPISPSGRHVLFWIQRAVLKVFAPLIKENTSQHNWPNGSFKSVLRRRTILGYKIIQPVIFLKRDSAKLGFWGLLPFLLVIFFPGQVNFILTRRPWLSRTTWCFGFKKHLTCKHKDIYTLMPLSLSATILNQDWSISCSIFIILVRQ